MSRLILRRLTFCLSICGAVLGIFGPSHGRSVSAMPLASWYRSYQAARAEAETRSAQALEAQNNLDKALAAQNRAQQVLDAAAADQAIAEEKLVIARRSWQERQVPFVENQHRLKERQEQASRTIERRQRLEKALHEHDAQIQRLEETICHAEKLGVKKTEVQRRIQELETQARECQAVIEQAQQAKADADRIRSEVSAKLDLARRQVADAQNLVDQERSRVAPVLAALEKVSNQVKTTTERQVAEAETRWRAAKEALNLARQKLSQAETHLADARRRVADAEKDAGEKSQAATAALTVAQEQRDITDRIHKHLGDVARLIEKLQWTTADPDVGRSIEAILTDTLKVSRTQREEHERQALARVEAAARAVAELESAKKAMQKALEVQASAEMALVKARRTLEEATRVEQRAKEIRDGLIRDSGRLFNELSERVATVVQQAERPLTQALATLQQADTQVQRLTRTMADATRRRTTAHETWKTAEQRAEQIEVTLKVFREELAGIPEVADLPARKNALARQQSLRNQVLDARNALIAEERLLTDDIARRTRQMAEQGSALKRLETEVNDLQDSVRRAAVRVLEARKAYDAAVQAVIAARQDANEKAAAAKRATDRLARLAPGQVFETTQPR